MAQREGCMVYRWNVLGVVVIVAVIWKYKYFYILIIKGQSADSHLIAKIKTSPDLDYQELSSDCPNSGFYKRMLLFGQNNKRSDLLFVIFVLKN